MATGKYTVTVADNLSSKVWIQAEPDFWTFPFSGAMLNVYQCSHERNAGEPIAKLYFNSYKLPYFIGSVC